MLKKLNDTHGNFGIKIQQMPPQVEGMFTVQVVLSIFEEMPEAMLGKGQPTIKKEVNAIRTASSFENAERKALNRAIELIGLGG